MIMCIITPLNMQTLIVYPSAAGNKPADPAAEQSSVTSFSDVGLLAGGFAAYQLPGHS